MATEKEVLIYKLEQARAHLNSALDRMAPQIEIYPTWKLKQIMDHITGWDELVAAAFHTHSQGQAPALTVMNGIDHYNAESVNTRRTLPLGESREAYDAARQKVLQALSELPEEKLSTPFPAPWGGMCTVASVVAIFVSHEQEHAKQVEEVLRQSEKTSQVI